MTFSFHYLAFVTKQNRRSFLTKTHCKILICTFRYHITCKKICKCLLDKSHVPYSAKATIQNPWNWQMAEPTGDGKWCWRVCLASHVLGDCLNGSWVDQRNWRQSQSVLMFILLTGCLLRRHHEVIFVYLTVIDEPDRRNVIMQFDKC